MITCKFVNNIYAGATINNATCYFLVANDDFDYWTLLIHLVGHVIGLVKFTDTFSNPFLAMMVATFEALILITPLRVMIIV